HYRWIVEKAPRDNWQRFRAEMSLVQLKRQGGGKREEVLKEYERLLGAYGVEANTAAEIHDSMAQVLMEMGKPEEAGKHYRWIVEKAPRDNWQRFRAEMILIEIELHAKGRTREAIQAYLELLSQHKKDPEIVRNVRQTVGQLYLEVGEEKEAKKYLSDQ
ncbi:MAG TPA: hypothetical protein P5079_03220, partial [Elusimicrobiota bacterium]|nr:hypothetical protein [Elusimicrobiota bacterium]